jgi:hypothetical protein
MTTPSTACPPTRPIDLALLRALLDASVGATTDPDDGATAIGVCRGEGDALDVAVHPLEGSDPVGSLYGFVAPPDWFAMGVLATGTVQGTPPRRVRLGVLVTRFGEQIASTSLGDAPDGTGRIPDACRRALRLATPAPEADTAELWAAWWLDAMVSHSLAAGGALHWADAVRLHPAFAPVAGADAELGALIGDHLVELGRAASLAWTWERLLASTRSGSGPVPGLEPEVARWMDVGMFSREVLGALPPVDDLVADLRDAAAPGVAEAVERCLRAWGVAPPGHPSSRFAPR